MKSVHFVFLISTVLCGFILGLILPAISTKKAEIEFKEDVVDLGIIERESVVSHKVTFKNCFDRPVWIESIKRSCGCLASDFSAQPIVPGDSGEILVSLDAKQGMGKRNDVIIKNLTIKFAPVDLEKVVTIRALPLDDIITESEEVSVNLERQTTNQIKVERGFLPEADFKKLSIEVAEGAKVIIAARNQDFIEFVVNYQGRKFAPSDLVLLKYRKKQEQVVKWLRIVEDKTGMPDLRPLNFFKRINKDVDVPSLESISSEKFSINDGGKKLEVARIFFENNKTTGYFGWSLDRAAKNEFVIFLTTVPEKSIVEEAVVEFVEIESGKKRSCKLPVRVLVQKDKF